MGKISISLLASIRLWNVRNQTMGSVYSRVEVWKILAILRCSVSWWISRFWRE